MDDTRRGRQKTKIAATASSRPTVANDAANGHLCDIYDIYIYQWYWGISELLVWFTQQGENSFQGRNLLWKLLIRHICVCCPIFGGSNLCLMPHARCHTILSLSYLRQHFFSHISFCLAANNFWQCRRGRGRADALDLCPQWLVCVCVCECVLGLLAFRALWSDILINCTLACSNGPTCNREQSAESDTVSCFTCTTATCLPAPD